MKDLFDDIENPEDSLYIGKYLNTSNSEFPQFGSRSYGEKPNHDAYIKYFNNNTVYLSTRYLDKKPDAIVGIYINGKDLSGLPIKSYTTAQTYPNALVNINNPQYIDNKKISFDFSETTKLEIFNMQNKSVKCKNLFISNAKHCDIDCKENISISNFLQSKDYFQDSKVKCKSLDIVINANILKNTKTDQLLKPLKCSLKDIKEIRFIGEDDSDFVSCIIFHRGEPHRPIYLNHLKPKKTHKIGNWNVSTYGDILYSFCFPKYIISIFS